MGYKLVIAVRSDLGMSAGKTASPAAPAAASAALSAPGSPQLPAWLDDGQGKIVVRVTSLEVLREKVEEARARGLRATVIADAGRTELEPGTETSAVFDPYADEALAPFTGQLPLLCPYSLFPGSLERCGAGWFAGSWWGSLAARACFISPVRSSIGRSFPVLLATPTSWWL